MLARVDVEHEADEGAGEPGPFAQEYGEARARHARRALEVEDAQRRPEIPVRLGFEVENAWRAPAPHLDVVLGAGAFGHARMRRVGQRLQQRRPFLLDAGQLRVQCLDLVCAQTVLRQQLRGVGAGLLGLGDLLPDAVPLGLQALHTGQQFPALPVEVLEAVEHGIGAWAPRLEASACLVEGVPELGGIEHRWILCVVNGPGSENRPYRRQRAGFGEPALPSSTGRVRRTGPTVVSGPGSENRPYRGRPLPARAEDAATKRASWWAWACCRSSGPRHCCRCSASPPCRPCPRSWVRRPRCRPSWRSR